MAGGMSEIYQEGLRIPPLRVFTADGVDQEKLALILANVRGPTEREGGLMAQMAATRAGARLEVQALNNALMDAFRSSRR